MEAYNTAVVAKEQLLHLLNEYRENNALIAKLKALKPVVSKTLWSLVLLSVSTVFSQLRGVQSVVTRDSDGFLIDGKKARSYSGSTKRYFRSCNKNNSTENIPPVTVFLLIR